MPSQIEKSELLDTIFEGDSAQVLNRFPEKSVHQIITSPPYWGLRDYGHDSQLGLEESIEDYISSLCDIFDQAKRVLRDDGTFWLNIGDSYAGNMSRTSKGRAGMGADRDGVFKRMPEGLQEKDLVGVPWRIALECQKRGWILRSDIIWAKTNPMPESVTDRCTKSHEYVFMFSKQQEYYFDNEPIREDTGSNKRDVWRYPSAHFKGGHFATFPEELIVPMIQAGTSQHGCCKECGAPYRREKELTEEYKSVRGEGYQGKDDFMETGFRGVKSLSFSGQKYKTTDWVATCSGDEGTEPCIVMDIFMGSGTTAKVAKKCGRHYTGIELNPKYVEVINNRQSLKQKELFI